MWKLGNRVVIVLVCVLSGCIILYNIWESVLGVIITILLVIYASVLLLTDDHLHQSPHALLLIEYIERTGWVLYNLLQNITIHTTTYTINLFDIAKRFYENYILTIMDRRRRNTYQLSTDTFVNVNRNTEFSMIEGLSPIGKSRRRSYISGSENNSGVDSMNPRGYDNAKTHGKVTSTPLIRWDKSESRNGDINRCDSDIINDNDEIPLKRLPSLYLNDHTMTRDEETIYSPRGSPWGTSISPKMRPRAAGVKTVQTVAGPLLTSTRYNIDPKVFTDITSPGLTSRLTKYASEANAKLIHQSQYGTGQFPKVNLNASPTPITRKKSFVLNKNSPKARTSVLVRVAPPETTKYSLSERQIILSAMCHIKNKTPSSVAQAFKEISLKRHASRDDITVELAKKQRTDSIRNDELENCEELTQKRGRDDSSKSELELSNDNILLRPSKRSKMPSCYDILNSLSSSTNVSAGIKRKADISRSGTPDIGKHFKSFDSIQRSRSLSSSPQENNIYRTRSDIPVNDVNDGDILKEVSSHSVSPKVISPRMNNLKKIIVEDEKISSSNNSQVKLTDRLFMRAEPQNIDKLKSLIAQHENVSSKFSGDDDDEIKKCDVVIMRQTSMKTRLQSMFDAISGKVSGQIDPNVVIQAEQVNNSPVAIVTTSSLLKQQSLPGLATLNSSTSTTNINTSPISTSAVVPIIGNAKISTTPGKHVTFLLPSVTTSMINETTLSPAITKSSVLSSPSSTPRIEKMDELKNIEVKDYSKSLPSLFCIPYTISQTLAPAIGTSSSNAVSTTRSAAISSSSAMNFSTLITSSTNANTSQLFTVSSTSPASATAFKVLQSTTQQNVQSNPSSSSTMTSAKPVTTTIAPNYSFGTPTVVSAVVNNSQINSTVVTQTAPMFNFQSTATPLPSVTSTSSANLFVSNIPTTTALFSGNANTNSSAITTPVLSFGQPSNHSSSTQIITNPTTKGTFKFGSSNNSTVNSITATTTQSDISTKLQTVTTTTPSTSMLPDNNSTKSPFTFGSNVTSADKTLPTFGLNNSVTTTGLAQVTTSSSMFSFGTIPVTAKSGFPFGSSNSCQTTVTNNSFAFNGSNQPPASAITSSNFNSPSVITSIQNPSAFGNASATISQANITPSSGTMSFTFNTPNAKQSIFPSTTTNSTNVNTNISQFNVVSKSTQPSNFTINSPINNSTTNMSSNLNTLAAATTSAPLFNSVNNSDNIFGTSKIMSSTGTFGTQSLTSSNFTANTATTFGNTGQSLFVGQQPVTTAGFSNSPSVVSMSPPAFGTSNITTQAVTTAPPPIFGGVNSSSTPSSFGTLKSISSHYSGESNSFSTLKPTSISFGTQNQSPATTFNTSTLATFATGPTTVITTTAPSAFGATPPSTSLFATSSGFGNTNATPSAFGNPENNTAFNSGFGGTNINTQISPFDNQSSNTSTFGNSNSSVPSFGTSLSNNANNGSGGSGSGIGLFTFGNTPMNSQPQQQNPAFSFNANNNNTNANGAAVTPFQFNSIATPQPGGFNFTGGAPTPTFGASSAGGSGSNSSGGGGMFSIGSGSTAPRSRSTRSRRQQR